MTKLKDDISISCKLSNNGMGTVSMTTKVKMELPSHTDQPNMFTIGVIKQTQHTNYLNLNVTKPPKLHGHESVTRFKKCANISGKIFEVLALPTCEMCVHDGKQMTFPSGCTGCLSDADLDDSDPKLLNFELNLNKIMSDAKI